MANMDDYFDSPYLRAQNLAAVEQTCTVAEVKLQTMRNMQGEDEDKWTIIFQEHSSRPFVLNKTNYKAIRKTLGPESETWVGATIQLYQTLVNVKGEEHLTIRVRSAFPKGAVKPQTAPQDLPKGEVPF